MTIQRADTFTRANVGSGWGTASDGNAWTSHAGDGQSVASNEGVINGSSASTFTTLGASLSGADAEGLVRFEVQDNTNTLGLLLRFKDTSNYYLARFDGNGNIAFFKNIAGTKTTVGSYTFAPGTSTKYWLRFHVSGTTIKIKTWTDGSGEPGTWNYTTTDSGIAGTGGNNFVGLYGFSNGSPNNYDSFSVDDLVVPNVPLSGSIPAGSSLSGVLEVDKALSAAIPSGQGLSGTLSTGVNLVGAVPSGASLSAAALAVTRSLSAVVPSGAALSGAMTISGAGTGIGDITRSTGTQTANKSGNGYGAGDLTGTEHDYIYVDGSGSGWAVGANPWYGGMPISAWYQIDPGLNTTLPQRTSKTGNQMSLLTTQSGGIVHWEEDGPGGFQSSELVTFQNGGNLTELAPASTPFRAYIKAIGDATDANGIAWTAYACIYPGDPGFVVFRFDQHNPTGSAISVDESDIEVIASLLTDTGSPAGVWSPTHGFIGTIGGAVTNGWPADAVHQNGTFDFMGITPDPASGILLGTGAAVLSDPSADFGWTNGGYEAHISPASGSPGRIKIGFYSDVSSAWNIPAGQTNTFYVLRVFRRGLTSTDMAAIAADYKFPGTPTTTTGSYTSYSNDERAYVFAAASNALSATLDLSPTHVTTRYKPVFKITGWTTLAPHLAWGGTTLLAGSDYRYVIDATNNVLYVQLYFDVVASGAVSGQRNNSALAISSPAIALNGSLPSGSGLSALLAVTRPLSATIASGANLSGTLHPTNALSGVILSGAALPTSSLLVTRALPGLVPSSATLSGTLTVGGGTVALAGSLPSSSALSGLLAVTRPLASTLTANPGASGLLGVTRPLSATVASGSALSAQLVSSRPLSGMVLTGSGAAGLLAVTRPLAALVPSSAGLSGTLSVPGALIHLSGAVPSSPGLSGALQVTRPLVATIPSLAAVPAATLAVSRPLHGTTAPAPGLSGVLSTVIPFAATISSGSGLTGVLHVVRALAATCPTGSGLSGALQVGRPLSVVVPSGAGLAGTLTVPSSVIQLSATVSSAAALSAQLLVIRPLVGSVTASPSLTALLILPRTVAGTIVASAGLTATLAVTRPLSGTSTAAPAINGTLHASRTLSGTVSAAPGLSAAFARSVPLAGALSAAPGLAALLGVTRPLSATLTAAPALSGVVNFLPTGITYQLLLTLSDTALAQLNLSLFTAQLDLSTVSGG